MPAKSKKAAAAADADKSGADPDAAVWYYKKDLRFKGNKGWSPYSKDFSDAIEQGFQAKEKSIVLNKTWKVDYKQKLQYRITDESRNRPIKRVLNKNKDKEIDGEEAGDGGGADDDDAAESKAKPKKPKPRPKKRALQLLRRRRPLRVLRVQLMAVMIWTMIGRCRHWPVRAVGPVQRHRRRRRRRRSANSRQSCGQPKSKRSV